MKRLWLVAPILLLSACASIITGSKSPVTFVSSPEGAKVSVSGVYIGTTPVTANLTRKTGQSILFEKEGYKPMTMSLETRMNNWFWGNILFGGLIGSTTDSMTGAAYRYDPSHYLVTLEPTSVSVPIEKGPLRTNDQKIREFVIMSYEPLTNDIRSGKGEYLSSLMTLLNIPPSDEPMVIKQLSELEAMKDPVADFATKVAALARPAQ